MFFNKNVMYERLKSLYLYSQICSVSELEELDRITCDNQRTEDAYGKEVILDKKTPYRYYFNSGLGTVKIEFDKEHGIDGTPHYFMWYSNYAGTTVFKIDATKKDLQVTPMLGEILTAQDIDLAIYELESYLKVNLGTSKDLYDKKNNEYKRYLLLHEEQLKLLKGEKDGFFERIKRKITKSN